MKSILSLIAALVFSLQSFAGDLYLVCSREDGSNQQDVSIVDGAASLTIDIISALGEQEQVEVSVQHIVSTWNYDFTIKSLSTGQSTLTMAKTLEVVKIGDMNCAVAD